MAMGSIYIIYYITGNSKIYCVLLIYRTCYKTNTPAQFPTKPTPPNTNSNRNNMQTNSPVKRGPFRVYIFNVYLM